MEKINTVVTNGYTITNSALAQSTKKILNLAGEIKSNYFKIGLELIHIRDKKLYEETNNPELKSFIGYCENALCLSRATAYRIIATTEKVFLPLRGHHKDILNLPDVALSKMTILEGPSDVINFVETKRIVPDMTVKEVELLLKEYRKEKEDKHEYADGVLEEGNLQIEKHDTEVLEAKKAAEAIRADMAENSELYPSEDYNIPILGNRNTNFDISVYKLLNNILLYLKEEQYRETLETISKFINEWYDFD